MFNPHDVDGTLHPGDLNRSSRPHDVDGPRFGRRERGRGDNRADGQGELPALLLHGLGGSRIAWEPQLRELGRQRRVIAWDMPGYGASAAPAKELTFPLLAAAVTALLDELEIARAHLVGLSFGGMIAQYTAAAYPERIASLSLLSTSPAFGLDGTSPEAWRNARMAPLEAGLEPADFADEVLTAVAGPGITEAQLERQRAAMARISADGLRAAIDCLITHDSRGLLHRITAPTQVLVGVEDRETPLEYAQALADGIDGATLTAIPDAGHLLNEEAPAHVNRLLADHFREAQAR